MKKYSNYRDLPVLSEKGFVLIDMPDHIWKPLKEVYEKLKAHIKPEVFKHQLYYIHDKEEKESPIEKMDINKYPKIKEQLSKDIQIMLEEWAGVELVPSALYGIRSYKKGAILKTHRDRIATHHIGVILLVDENLEKDWPLDIQDHDGNWHKVYTKPGQVIMYESARCVHGRTEEFQGEYFRNCFSHYKLKGWEYQKDTPETSKGAHTST